MSIEGVVQLLNTLLILDPIAINKFFLDLGVEVNNKISNNPDIQVCFLSTNVSLLRPLGLINGFWDDNRVIAMITNDDGVIQKFSVINVESCKCQTK
jgi:hypothetical protein